MGLLVNLPDDEVWAFLTTIRANPADETARLVFADWLDEQGDPRGPLFRGNPLSHGIDLKELLAEWSDIPHFDPFAGVGQHRGLLRVAFKAGEYDRIGTDAYPQLYRAAQQGWVASFGFYGGSVDAILSQSRTFRRLIAGAIEVSITNEEADGITDVGLAGIRRLGNLTKLSLSGCALTDAALAHLRRHPRLAELSLDGVFTEAGIRHLRRLPCISRIELSGQAVDLG